MPEYDFHPKAEIDLNEIWEYIADDSVSAADRVMLTSTERSSVRFYSHIVVIVGKT